MNPRTFKFGGREFTIEDINQIRQLALGPVVADRWCFSARREPLLRLKCMDYATVETAGEGSSYEKLTYRANDRLLELKAQHDASVVSFDTMARREKKDISLKACRAFNRKLRVISKAAPLRTFPTREDVLHHGLIEAQSPLFTQSPPVEPGDQFEFSSRGLTDWYVGEFCKTNHYRK